MTKLEWLQKWNKHANVITRKHRQDLVSDPSLDIVGPFASYP
jgi:16S rRNA G527 N7-methylase RsmG